MTSVRPGVFKRRFLVDKKVQFTILGYTFFVASATIFLSGAGHLLLRKLMMDPNLQISSLQTPMFLSIASSFLAIFTLSLFGLVLSNRIAGPMFRLRQHMKAIADGGGVQPIKFRKADQFEPLSHECNRVLERLRQAEHKTERGVHNTNKTG